MVAVCGPWPPLTSLSEHVKDRKMKWLPPLADSLLSFTDCLPLWLSFSLLNKCESKSGGKQEVRLYRVDRITNSDWQTLLRGEKGIYFMSMNDISMVINLIRADLLTANSRLFHHHLLITGNCGGNSLFSHLSCSVCHWIHCVSFAL